MKLHNEVKRLRRALQCGPPQLERLQLPCGAAAAGCMFVTPPLTFDQALTFLTSQHNNRCRYS